jgi:hypothetical protein
MEEVSHPVIADVRVNWHWIRPIIEDILMDCPQFTYIPEDVYAACKSGNAQCWVHRGGFVISKIDLDMYSGERSFFIWIAGATEMGHDFATRFNEFFKDVARQNGCTKIETGTGMQEVEAHLIHSGWTRNHTIFSQNLVEGRE